MSISRPGSASYDIKIQEADSLFQLSSANRIDKIGLKGDIKRYFVSSPFMIFHSRIKQRFQFFIQRIKQRFQFSKTS
jgi:hypothetical protein